MAGAVGIVFGLCVLSFTSGAALMYVVLRRREDAASPATGTAEKPADRAWVPQPVVEPVEDDYDSRPIHRNPVVGLRQLEPALASLVDPVVEPEVRAEPAVEAEPVIPEEVADEPAEEPGEESAEADADEPEPVEPELVEPEPVEPELVEPEPVEPVVSATLPPPASPQPAEHTTWVEREDFRARYLRTFEEVRRKADSN